MIKIRISKCTKTINKIVIINKIYNKNPLINHLKLQTVIEQLNKISKIKTS